jgi:dGTPase
VILNEDAPALSKVRLGAAVKNRVEALKHLTYQLIIQSPRLKTVEYRGSEIVETIFKALVEKGGDHLLPDDFQSLVRSLPGELERKRTVCDFIAGMTDRYAIEFYGRLKSENSQNLFKPL